MFWNWVFENEHDEIENGNGECAKETTTRPQNRQQ